MSISLGPLTLHAYGFLLALAVFTATFLTAQSAKSKGLDSELVWDGLFWVLIFGLIGARAYHVIHLWDFYSADPKLIYQLWLGGMAIWGAVMGGLAGAVLFARIRRISWAQFFSYLNLAAPYIALGQAIGRVGNIINGELLPFAYYEAAFDFALFLGLLVVGSQRTAHRRFKIPNLKSQITKKFKILNSKFETFRKLKFEKLNIVWNLPARRSLGAGGVLGIWNFGRRRSGEVSFAGQSFPLYLILYGGGRFFLEFTRPDAWKVSLPAFGGGGLAIAQVFSIIAVVSGLIFLLPKK